MTSRSTGFINPSGHATLAFSDIQCAERPSLGCSAHACNTLSRHSALLIGSYLWLKAYPEIRNLQAMPCIYGSRMDVPSMRRAVVFKDIAFLCTDPNVELGWWGGHL